MPTKTIHVYEYTGNLLSADLLSGTPTVLLSTLVSGEDGALVDDQGTLSSADDGVSTYNG